MIRVPQRKLTRFLRVFFVCASFAAVVIWFCAPAPPLKTPTEKSNESWISFPAHLSELFAVAELKLVALDPILLKCVRADDCMELIGAPSIQIGTFLSDMQLLGMIFDLNLEDKNWSLRLVNNHTAVLTSSYWTGFEKNVVLSVLQEQPGKDYFRIAAENSLEIEERAIDKFETTELKGFTVPSRNIDEFRLRWRNSRFVECNRTLAESIDAGERFITAEHIANFKKFTNELLESGQEPILAFGSLLGWYRHCGVIPYISDIDAVVKFAQFNETFITEYMNVTDEDWKSHVNSLHMPVRIPGELTYANADIIYLYSHNSTFDWTSLPSSKAAPGESKLKTFLPAIHEICSGDVDGHLFFIPCNYKEVLLASYGLNWQEPLYFTTSFGRNWNSDLENVLKIR